MALVSFYTPLTRFELLKRSPIPIMSKQSQGLSPLAEYLHKGEIQGEILKILFLEKSEMNHVITYISANKEIYRDMVKEAFNDYNVDRWDVNEQDEDWVYDLFLIHNQMHDSLLNALIYNLNTREGSIKVCGRDKWYVLNELLKLKPLPDTVERALGLILELTSFVIKISGLYLEKYCTTDQEKSYWTSFIIETKKRQRLYKIWEKNIKPELRL